MKFLSVKFIKKTFFIQIIMVLVLSSCQKPDLNGHWHIYDEYGLYLLMDIRNDSVFMNNNAYGKDRFIVTRNTIIIPDYFEGTYKYSLSGDTCLLFKKDTVYKKMIRKFRCKKYEDEVELKIDLNLPEFAKDRINKYLNYSEKGVIHCPIYVGKAKDKSKTNFIQLNNELAVLGDIPLYVDAHNETCHYTKVVLFIDKRMKMKHVDEILFELRKCPIHTVVFAFDIKEDYRKVGVLTRRLTPLSEEYFKQNIHIPPPPQKFVLKNIIKDKKNLKISSLKNKLHIADIELSTLQLNDTIKKYWNKEFVGKKRKIIIIDWDENSSFQKYAEILVLLDNCRNNFRNKKAIKEYKKAYNDLYNEDQISLKRKYPVGIIDYTPTDKEVLRELSD